MNSRYSKISRIAVATLASAAVAFAQAPPPPGPAGPGGRHRHGLMEFGWLEVGLTGKTVTGAPYSAQIVSQRTQTLSDGTHVTSQSKGSVSRDSSGRVRREMSMTGLTQFTGAQQPEHAVFINDPVAGYQYVLHSDEKVVDRRPAPAAGAVKDQAAGRPRREGSQVATESLGTQMIEGVSAEGTRITKTIPAGTFGNDKAIQIVIERWYSPDLQTYVLVKQSDPRMGESTMRLTNITRNEPPSSLFAVPSDYSVRDHAAPPEFGPRGGRGGPPKD